VPLYSLETRKGMNIANKNIITVFIAIKPIEIESKYCETDA
jgi:hypothetical protein